MYSKKQFNRIGTAIFAVLIFVCVFSAVCVERCAISDRSTYRTDGGNEVAVVTDKGRAEVKINGRTVWKSPSEWYVRKALLADLNQVHGPELILLLWKTGSFGSARPFWLEEERDISYGTHIFVFEVHRDGTRMLWGASETPFVIEDINLSRREAARTGILIKERLHDVWWPSLINGWHAPVRENLWYWEHWGLKSDILSGADEKNKAPDR